MNCGENNQNEIERNSFCLYSDALLSFDNCASVFPAA